MGGVVYFRWCCEAWVMETEEVGEVATAQVFNGPMACSVSEISSACFFSNGLIDQQTRLTFTAVL